MDASTPYVDPAVFKATLTLTGESFADVDISAALLAASRGIDKATGRRFWPDADALQVRYYTPRSCDLVVIDDLITVGSVKTDTANAGAFPTTLATADYVLKPLNAAADGAPYTRIVRHSSSSAFFDPCAPRSVKVTGKFGWSAVPAPVVEATTILAAKLLRRAREAPFGVVSLGLDGTAVRIARTDPDVCFLIDPYVLPRLV